MLKYKQDSSSLLKRNSKKKKKTFIGKSKIECSLKSKKNFIENSSKINKGSLLTKKNTLGAKISNRSKLIHMILKNQPKKESLIHSFSEFFFFIFLNRLIFENFILEKIENEKNWKDKNFNFFLSKNSIFASVSMYLNPLKLTQIISQDILFGLIIFYISLILFFSLIFWNFNFLKKIIPDPEMIKKIAFKNFFIKFFSRILTISRLLIFFTNTIFFHSFRCRAIIIKSLLQEEDNFKADSQFFKQHYDQSKTSIETFIDKEQSSPFNNNNIVCGTTTHKFLIIFSILAIGINFSLMLINWRIFKSQAKVSLRQSTRGPFELVFQTSLNSLLYFQSLLKSKNVGFSTIRTYFLCCFFVSFGLYAWVILSKPYYNRTFLRVTNLRLIFLTTLSSLCYVQLGLKDSCFFCREKSSFIVLLISLSVLIRLDLNFNRVDIKKISMKLSDVKSIESKTIHQFYFEMKKFISIIIQEADGRNVKSKEIEEYYLLIAKLKSHHQNECQKISCFCRRDALFEVVNSLMVSKKLRKKENFLLEAIMLLNEFFQKYFKITPDPEHSVFISYLDFLVNIMGKPELVYQLILNYQLKKIKKNKIEKEDKIETNIGVILLDLDELTRENLQNGVMALRQYHTNFQEESNSELEKDEEKYRYLDSIVFLQKFENMKADIRIATELKRDYLTELQRLKVKLLKICEISEEFYLRREMVKKKFLALKKIAGVHYSAVYCVYANFMMDVCEDKKEGVKAMKRYLRIKRNLNLNKVFDIKELIGNECVIMNVEVDQVFQKFVYVTSNFQRILGKRIFLNNFLNNFFKNLNFF